MMKAKLLAVLCALFLLVPVAALAGEKPVAEYVLFGHYPHSADGTEEPILWRVLEGDAESALLISLRVLDCRQAEKSLDAFASWETSSLSQWLTGDFLRAAFSRQEQAALLPGITLPTSEMMKDELLGFGSNASRRAAATPYAIKNGAEREGSYWLSSVSSSNRYSLRRTMSDGALGYSAVTRALGIRPVIRIDLSLTEINGAGTREDPAALVISQAALDNMSRLKAAEEERIKLEEEAKIEAAKEAEAALSREKADKERALAAAQAALDAAILEGRDTAALKQSVADAAQALSLVGGMAVEGFPRLTKEGFLPQGEEEYIQIEPENGLWRYCSKDLRIQITRHQEIREEGRKVRYLLAEIHVREGAEGFHMIPYDAEHRKEDRELYIAKQNVIAKENKTVFAMGGDYYLFRMNRKGLRIGVVIRDGGILFDEGPTKPRNHYPPLQLMALYPDGDLRVFGYGETTAAELISGGARDVLSFGPYLIKDGVVNMDYVNYGYNFEPRVGIGMVEKGHYYALVVEGRIPESRGMACRETAELLKQLGCTQAFNLDGGWTSSMIFMGQQLNQLDKSGVHNNARPQNEILGVGYTDKMDIYAGEDKP